MFTILNVVDLSYSFFHVFLLFQGVHETPCSDAYLQLEKLVARVVSPYLGILGVYNGNKEPEIRSNFKLPPQIYILGNYLFYITTHLIVLFHVNLILL